VNSGDMEALIGQFAPPSNMDRAYHIAMLLKRERERTSALTIISTVRRSAGTTFTIHEPRAQGCWNCVYHYGTECRRNPPVAQAVVVGGGTSDSMSGFQPASFYSEVVTHWPKVKSTDICGQHTPT
jgi:hypothetical protein